MNDLEYKLELRKLSLEKTRLRVELMKWMFIAFGAVASFWIIDIGKLKLEQYRAQSQNERELLISYLGAMESERPEVWRRKIQFLMQYSNDSRIKSFSHNQIEYINKYAELGALYRETLKVASMLSVRDSLTQSERGKKIQKFEQLYWAELPLAGESESVSKAMIKFRKQLYSTYNDSKSESEYWKHLNVSLLELATAIRSSMPNNIVKMNG
ncbi:hypothetical protein VDIAB_290006 [Vibrio diabolicus]|nr:hypothetical protein VDIAB_290006 [Vibrio diabolicus]